ncbi:GNAT family N-acetyltransferase [Clostridiales bacterium]|nr:GNAT family N-acetyltransferase [Clostridiales bacterium]
MKIECDGITLRDYQVSDIEDEIRWTTVDTSWFYEDTPWMTMEPADPDTLRRDMTEIISGMSDDAIRWRLEIEVNGRHVGFVSSYLLDDHFQATPWELIDPRKNAAESHSVRALGIEICEADCRGRGIGGKSLTAFMDYYRQLGEHRFLLETWSGNARMLGCAKKLGFVEIRREKGAYTVSGKAYDSILMEKS